MCTCGTTETHIIGKRRTFDGYRVALWSDGAITGGLNAIVRYAPRSAVERARAVEAGWLMLGEVELYEYSELPKLVDAARAAVAQKSLEPARYLRSRMVGAKFQAIKRGRTVRHARSCDCPRCERERLAVGGTAPLRGPRVTF